MFRNPELQRAYSYGTPTSKDKALKHSCQNTFYRNKLIVRSASEYFHFRYILACEQALRGALVAAGEGGRRARHYVSGI